MASLFSWLSRLLWGERRSAPRDPLAAQLSARQLALAERLDRIERIRHDARLAQRRLRRAGR